VQSRSEQSDVEGHDQDEGSDVDVDDASSDQVTEMTEGSFVKLGDGRLTDEDALDGVDISKPDVYDVNVLAWDTPVSPLHLAILGGHTEAIKVLVSTFGAEVLLPIKVVDTRSQNPKHAIMTLVLAAQLSGPTSRDVTKELISLGASSAQGDMQQITALHYLVAKRKVLLLKACLENDGAAARSVLNHLNLQDVRWRPKSDTPLTTAIKSGNEELVDTLLDFGAKPFIDIDEFAAAYTQANGNSSTYGWRDCDTDVAEVWKDNTVQPVFLALRNDMPNVIADLLDAGVDINAINIEGYEAIARSKDGAVYAGQGGTLLDAVVAKICDLESALNNHFELPKPIALENDQAYLKLSDPGSYERWYLSNLVQVAKNIVQQWQDERNKRLKQEEGRLGKQRRVYALRALRARFMSLKDRLLRTVCILMQNRLNNPRPGPQTALFSGAMHWRSSICQTSSANLHFIRAHALYSSSIRRSSFDHSTKLGELVWSKMGMKTSTHRCLSKSRPLTRFGMVIFFCKLEC
jgi:ankyrin repeat protein